MVLGTIAPWVTASAVAGTCAIAWSWGRTPERVLSSWYLFAYTLSHFDGLWRIGDAIQDAIGLALFAPFAWRDPRFAIFWALTIKTLSSLAGVFSVVYAERLSWWAAITVGNVLGYLNLALLLFAVWQGRRTEAFRPASEAR